MIRVWNEAYIAREAIGELAMERAIQRIGGMHCIPVRELPTTSWSPRGPNTAPKSAA